mmetsp:Transcript_17088/g.58913  ORF Transcript_17088/g.58913 Transcript_17088/m.58913 type:complete len:338 (+) Transcript_17088:1311-2324(+)
MRDDARGLVPNNVGDADHAHDVPRPRRRRLLRRRLEVVGDEAPAADGRVDEDDRRAVGLEGLGARVALGPESAAAAAGRGDEVPRAHVEHELRRRGVVRASQRRGDAPADERVEGDDAESRAPPAPPPPRLRGRGDERGRERVLRAALGDADGVQQRVRERVAVAVVRDAERSRERRLLRGRGGEDVHGRHVRLPPRERARLVEDDGRHLVRDLQGPPALDEDAVARAEARAHHDRRRRRQPQGAGARDDQHGDAEEEGEEEAPLVVVPVPGHRLRRRERKPESKGRDGDGDDARDEVPRDVVRERLDLRLRPLRLLHELDDGREERLRAHCGNSRE